MMNKSDSPPQEGSGSAKRKVADESVSKLQPPFQKRSRTDNKAESADRKEANQEGDNEVDSVLNLLQREGAGTAAESAQQRKKSPTTSNVPVVPEDGVSFPERLMELIMDETDKEALWWLPDGSAFCIHSKKFTKTILANNFQGSKFESFTRKLARWGFKRFFGPDIPANTFIFEHPLFKKSQPALAKEISGSKKKNAVAGAGKSINLSKAAARAPGSSASAPAPWPTFNEKEQSSVTGSAITDAYNILNTASSSMLQGRSFGIPHQMLQPDLEDQVLLHSMMSSLNPSVEDHGGRRQDSFMRANLLAQQERARALSAASASARPAELALELATTLPTLDGTQGSRGLLSGYPLSSFVLDRQNLPNIYQQQAGLPPSNQASASSTAVDPLVRLYLQQQESQLQENRLLQQELLRQEILRREQQQRDNRGTR